MVYFCLKKLKQKKAIVNVVNSSFQANFWVAGAVLGPRCSELWLESGQTSKPPAIAAADSMPIATIMIMLATIGNFKGQ